MTTTWYHVNLYDQKIIPVKVWKITKSYIHVGQTKARRNGSGKAHKGDTNYYFKDFEAARDCIISRLDSEIAFSQRAIKRKTAQKKDLLALKNPDRS
jgi:hypothetical protein